MGISPDLTGGGWDGKTTSRRIQISRFRFHRMEASSDKRIHFIFRYHTFIGEFSAANVSFGCKGLMYLVDFSLGLGSLI